MVYKVMLKMCLLNRGGVPGRAVGPVAAGRGAGLPGHADSRPAGPPSAPREWTLTGSKHFLTLTSWVLWLFNSHKNSNVVANFKAVLDEIVNVTTIALMKLSVGQNHILYAACSPAKSGIPIWNFLKSNVKFKSVFCYVVLCQVKILCNKYLCMIH